MILKKPISIGFANRFLLEKEEVIKNIREEFPYEHIVLGQQPGKFML
jgi:hypothetical protein